MGYYTSFSIEVYRKEDRELKNDLLNIEGFDLACGHVLSIINDDFDSNCRLTELIMDDEMKWYDYDDDMRNLSLQFPDYVFVLSGQGEEYDDMWRWFYINGHARGGMAEIVYPEIDWDFFDYCDTLERRETE